MSSIAPEDASERPAAMILRAAAVMRDDADRLCMESERPFWTSLARWLTDTVAAHEFAWTELGETPDLDSRAVAVARAYLQEGE